jgi:glycosyltransferase involved in cell wall biosynthesis
VHQPPAKGLGPSRPDEAAAAPRVTVVTSRLDIGGTERHLARVLPELQRRGIDITLYAMQRGGPLEDELLRQGVRVAGPAQSWPAFLYWIKATFALAHFLRRERPAVVHFFLPRPYIYGSVAAGLAGHRRRLMSRRSLADYMDRYPFARGLERLLHRRTLGLIGNSKAVLDQLFAETGDRRKLALIYNGINIPAPAAAADRQRVRRSLQIDDDALVIAVVANLIPYKGHHDLITALAMVKDDLPKPWIVLMIGRDDGIGAQLRQTAAASGIARNIVWLGEQSEVEPLLCSSDIFVLPSHQEGFSSALLEAMGAGVAAIATAVGGNAEAVADHESGLLVQPHDPVGLAAAIRLLGGDAALRRRLADAARHRVQRLFSLDACVANYERLYRAMCEAEPRPLGEILPDANLTPSARATTPA